LYFLLRNRVPAWALLGVLMCVGIDPQFLGLSRVAIPEIPALFFTALSFATLLRPDLSLRRAMSAGVWLLVALAMKATMVLVAPSLLLVIWHAHRNETPRWRMQRIAAYSSAIAAPFLLAVCAAAVLGKIDTLAITHLVTVVAAFLAPQSTGDIVDMYLHGKIPPLTYLALAAAWIVICVRLISGQHIATQASKLYIASGIWGTWMFAVLTIIGYTPYRYFVHATLPLLIHAASGVALVKRVDLLALGDRLHARSFAIRSVLSVAMIAPAAIIVAPAIAWAAGALGFTVDRNRDHLAAIALAAAMLFGLAQFRNARRWFGIAATVTTGTCIAAIVVASQFGLLEHFWFTSSSDGLVWVIALLIGICAAVLFMSKVRPVVQRRTFIAVALSGSALLATTLSTVLIPTFTTQRVSRELAQRIPPGSSIWVKSASVIMLESTLKYREEWPPGRKPDYIVTFTCEPQDCVWQYEQRFAGNWTLGMVETWRRQLTFGPNRRISHVDIYLLEQPRT
jgi:hypothetical protein